jgi:hypothetical protein
MSDQPPDDSNVVSFQRPVSPNFDPRNHLRPILNQIAAYAVECGTSPAGIGAVVLLALLEESPDEAAAMKDVNMYLEEVGMWLSED